MTREEASNILDDYDVNFDGHTAEEIAEAFDVAFRALEQESCSDAVSRQAVLDILKDKWNMFSDANDAMQESIDTIEALSNVTPQPKMGWIPVSKRLPELNKPLLVTTYHRVYYGHLISESGNYGYPVFRIHGLGDKNRDWVQETMSHEPYSLGRIDAWMYLDIPEPYKVSEIPTGSEPQESEDKE